MKTNKIKHKHTHKHTHTQTHTHTHTHTHTTPHPLVGPNAFHNLNDHPSSNSGDFVVDSILRSSAAPVYFSAYQGFIDGGVFAK